METIDATLSQYGLNEPEKSECGLRWATQESRSQESDFSTG
jgi:hypothetical protein